MAQATTFSVPTVGPASPTTMAQRIDDNFNAVRTWHSGSSRPSYAIAGTVWEDTSVTNETRFYLYDGTDDNLLYTVNTLTGAVTFNVANSSITNAKLADMSQSTFKGRAAGAGTGAPTDLSVSEVFTALNGVFPAIPITSAGVGQVQAISAGSGVSLVLPSGGTWFATWAGFLSSTAGWWAGFSTTVAAGGTTIQAGVSGVVFTGFAWRIS